MNNRRIMAALLAGTLVLSACGSSDGDDVAVDAGAEPVSTTSTTIDLSRLSKSETWDDYRSHVDTDTAIACVLTRDVDPNYRRGMAEDKFAAIDDVFFAARDNPDDEDALRALTEYSQPEPAEEIDTWVYKQLHEHELLALVSPDPGSLEQLRAAYSELSEEVADASDGDLVDIGPVMRLWLQSNPVSLYRQDRGCPFSGGGTPLTQAMENFASDNASFGGRGELARGRCIGSAVVDLGLTALVEDPSDRDAAAIVELGYAVFDNHRGDEGWDVAAQEFSSAFLVMQNRAGGQLSEAELDQIEQLQTDWLDYRDTKPEGFILCPLDRGWTPS